MVDADSTVTAKVETIVRKNLWQWPMPISAELRELIDATPASLLPDSLKDDQIIWRFNPGVVILPNQHGMNLELNILLLVGVSKSGSTHLFPDMPLFYGWLLGEGS